MITQQINPYTKRVEISHPDEDEVSLYNAFWEMQIASIMVDTKKEVQNTLKRKYTK